MEDRVACNGRDGHRQRHLPLLEKGPRSLPITVPDQQKAGPLCSSAQSQSKIGWHVSAYTLTDRQKEQEHMLPPVVLQGHRLSIKRADSERWSRLPARQTRGGQGSERHRGARAWELDEQQTGDALQV
jgi:hypothetical protein